MFLAIFCLVWDFVVVIVFWFVWLVFYCCLPKLCVAWNPRVQFGSGLVLVWLPEQEDRPGASPQSMGWRRGRLDIRDPIVAWDS